MSDTKPLDPLTGLLSKPKATDPLGALLSEGTGTYRPRERGSQTQGLFGAVSTGDFSNYSDYGLDVSAQTRDYEELRAQRQSNWEKYGRGFTKLGVTAGASFVNTFTGMAGLLDYATDTSKSFSEKSLAAYEAKHARAIDTEEWRESIRKAMPHYYTREEIANKGTLEGIWTANFLSDKVFDGVGFFLGTAASMYATGGLGILGRAGQALKLSRSLAAYRTGKSLASGTGVAKSLNTYRNTKFWTSKVGGAAAYMEGAFYSSLGEAALEGRETGRITYEKLVEKAKKDKEFRGEDPNLTSQEMQQLKMQAQEAEASAFYGNVAVLTASNAVAFRGLLKPFKSRNVTSSFLRKTTTAERAAGKGLVVDKLADLPGGFRQVAQGARFSAPFLATMASEGTEEASQYAIQEGITDYQMARYNDAGLGELVEGMMDTSRIKALGEALPQIGKRASETFSNPESREQFIIGALVGILGGGKTSFQESQAKRKNRDVQEKLFNSPAFYNLAAKSEEVGVQSYFLKEMEKAEAAGDSKLYDFYQKKFRAAQILQHYEAGSLDMFREMMTDAKDLSEKEFKETFGYDADSKIDQNKQIDGILETVKEVEKSASFIDEMFATPTKRGVSRLFMSKEAKQLEDEEQADESVYKKFLKQEAATLRMVDGAIQEKVDKIKAMFPDSSLSVETEQKDGKKRVIDIENRLRRYARNAFGVVTEEGFTPSSPNLVKNMNTLLEDARKTMAPEQFVALKQELEDLRDLITQKDNGAQGLKNLLRDPKTRDLAISRAKLVERTAKQQKIDAVVDEAITSTVDSDELAEKVKGFKEAGVSEAAIEKANNEVRDRQATVAEARASWDTITRSDVAKLTGLTPLQEKARKAYLEGRAQEEPLVNTVEVARKKQAERDRQRRQNSKDDEPQAGKTKTDTSAAPGSENTNEPSATKEDALFTRSDGQGQFELTDDGKVFVSSTGQPFSNNLDEQRTVDGKPVIDRKDLLDSEEVKAGSTVELEVIEDSWWLENRNKTEYSNQAAHIPIYVRVPGKGIVGVLASNDSAMRRAVYENWKAGKQEEQAVTVKVAQKQLNNRNNAVAAAEDGTQVPFFFNVFETFGNVPIGVVIYDKDGTNARGITVANTQMLSPAEQASLDTAVQRTKAQGLKYGQVVVFAKNSNGEWRSHVVSTAKLNEAEQARALELLSKSSDSAAYNELVDLVGLNTLEPGEFDVIQNLFLQVEDRYIPGTNKRVIRMGIPIPTTQTTVPGAFLIASIDSETLEGLVNGTLTAADIRKNKNVLGNLVQEVTKDEEGRVITKGIGFQVLKQNDVADKFINSIVPELSKLIANKRRQVDIADMNTDPAAFQALASATHERNPNDTAAGFAGIIGTDIAKVNGSIHHDIGLSFDVAETRVGGKKLTAESVKITPHQPNTPPQAAPTNTERAFAEAAEAQRRKAAQQQNQEPGPQQEPGLEQKEPEFTQKYIFEPGITIEGKDVQVALGPKTGKIAAIQYFDNDTIYFVEKSNTAEWEKSIGPKVVQAIRAQANTKLDDNVSEDDAPFRLAGEDPIVKMDRAEAEAWLKKRGIPVEFYDAALRVGSSVAHGYMKNAGVYLWNNAEVGTEYHEAFHYSFRTMLTDKQREALYKEARVKYNLPNATPLELEEMMAEEFRDYVFTAQGTEETLPGKIKKFFQDLFNFIKALFTNTVEIQQFYSLIESNKMPKKFERSAERFEGKEAYRLVDAFNQDFEFQQEVVDSVSSVFIKHFKELEDFRINKKLLVTELLGTGENNKGEIARFFLKHSISNPDGTYVSEEALDAFAKATTKQERGAAAKKYKFIAGIPATDAILEGAIPISFIRNSNSADLKKAASVYFNVWNNWINVEDELGNVDKFGWRDAVAMDLKKYGYTVGLAKSQVRKDLIEDEGLASKEETNYDKIFNISHFEQDPTKTVSEEVRRLFSKITNAKENSVGFVTYVNVDEAIRASLAVAVGSQSYEEILGNIIEAAPNFEVLQPIANFLKGPVQAADAAALSRFFKKTYSEHRIVKEEMIEEAMNVKTINSDRKSAAIGWATSWKAESVSTEIVTRPGAVFIESKGKLKFNNNVIEGKARLQHIKSAIAQYQKASSTEAKAVALNDLMWFSSLGMARTKSEAEARLLSYLKKHEGNPEDEAQIIYNKLINAVISKALNLTTEGGIVKKATLKETPVNFFKSEGSTIKALAEIAAEFTLPTALAYVNGKGKTIYPYNLPTTFSDTLQDMRKGKDSELYQLMMKDPSLAMTIGEKEKGRALFLYLLESKEFDITSFSLDVVQNESQDDQNIEYKKLSERDSMILRLNMFLNDGQKYSYIPLPVQETRGRIDFLKVPTFGNPIKKSITKAGIPKTASGEQAMLTHIVLRDLVRLSLNPALAKNVNNGFHLSGITDVEVKGGRLSQVIQDALKYPKGPEYKYVFDEINSQVKNYSETVFQKYGQEFMQELAKYNILKLDEEKNSWSIPKNSRLDASQSNYGSVSEMVKAYMLTDLVARIEMAQAFRGGVMQFKDTTAFYKRMGLLNTPGDKLMMEGEVVHDPTYGIPKIIKEASIQKIRISDPYHDEIAGRIERMYVKYFENLNYSIEEAAEKARNIADQYKTDNRGADHTDAQAFISPYMFRNIEQGLGRWTAKDEQWFNEYIAGKGEWKAKYTPAYKFYAEERLIDKGVLNVDMQKNSYVVLTKDFVQGNELLTAMYNRMMNPNDPIDIINTESAKKSFKGQLFEVNQELGEQMFAGLESRDMDGSKLYMPQIINDKEDMTAKMNRQIRKGIPTMVDKTATYTLADGTTLTGEQLLNEYHNANEEIIQMQGKKLFDELGWTALKEDPSNNELRLNFLQRIREVIYDNKLKNNQVDSNLDKQLRLVEDLETGRYDFNVPLYFPVYQREFESLIYSLFKSNVYQIKLPGRELVQVAGPGKWEIDGEIRELRHLDIDESTGNVIHSEVLISQDVADRLGLKVGDTGIMYRIPNQDYSSNVPSRIAGILPKGYSKTVVVAGNITVQTGSDFDIDKLFGLFRDRNAKSKLAKRKNDLLNLSEAVLLNAKTAPYLFRPLTQDTLNALADEVQEGEEEMAFDNPLTEIRMESNYKSAATLVGGYANAISGWNIAAQAAEYNDPNSEYISTGTMVNSSKHFMLNGVLLNQINILSPFTQERTLDGIVERLSAALDAASKLIHTALNDNEQTLNATVYLKSIGFEDADVVALLTTPLVRQFVEKRRTSSAGVGTVFQELGISKKVYGQISKNDPNLETPVVNTEELKAITAANDSTSEAAKKAFIAFANAYSAGNSLSEYYEVIAVDNLDSMGDLGEVMAYLDTLENYRRGGDKNIVGYSEVEKILKGEAYRTMRAFYNMIDESMQVSSQLFLGGAESVKQFKSDLKEATGKTKLTAAEHRFTDRALFYHLLTKDGSPMTQFMRKDVIKSMLLNPNDNLNTQIQNLIKEIPTLQVNEMLSRAIPGIGNDKPTNRVWGISMENTEKMTLEAREKVRQDFGKLLYTPEIYTQGQENSEKLNKRIQNIAKRLVINSVVTTGLAPSFGTYYNSVPIDFFLQIKDEATGKSLMEYMREEFHTAKQDPRYFSDFMFDFVQNYGTSTIGGRPLISRVPSGFKDEGKILVGRKASAEQNFPRFATKANYKKGVDKVSVYEYKDGVYYKIHSLGIANNLLELNLRDAAGEVVRTSFWSAVNGQKIVNVKTSGGKVKKVNLTSRNGITSSQVGITSPNGEVKTTTTQTNLDKNCK